MIPQILRKLETANKLETTNFKLTIPSSVRMNECFYLLTKPVQSISLSNLQIQHIDYITHTATKYNLLNSTKGKNAQYPVSSFDSSILEPRI